MEKLFIGTTYSMIPGSYDQDHGSDIILPSDFPRFDVRDEDDPVCIFLSTEKLAIQSLMKYCYMENMNEAEYQEHEITIPELIKSCQCELDRLSPGDVCFQVFIPGKIMEVNNTAGCGRYLTGISDGYGNPEFRSIKTGKKCKDRNRFKEIISYDIKELICAYAEKKLREIGWKPGSELI